MSFFSQASSATKEIAVNAPIRFIGRQIEKNHFTKKPILIVACPRSGTTLLLSILSAIPTIFAIPKQTYAFDRWALNNDQFTPTLLYRLYREFVFRKIPVKADRWLEKTPGHIRSIGKILAYFNNEVKIIHIIRDGRDVTVSTHPAYRDKRKYWVSADRWVTEVNIGLSFQNHPSVHTMKYEDLISNYEDEIKKITTFIGEPFTEQLLHWIDHTQIKSSIHWGSKVQEISAKPIGKWKNPEHTERIKEFMDNAEAIQLLQKLGYPV
jgi:hypothetical protein